MAYRRRAPRPDIRSLHINQLPEVVETKTDVPISQESMVYHNPKKELLTILICTVPLFIALAVGTYLDITRPWVLTFANWMMRIGG